LELEKIETNTGRGRDIVSFSFVINQTFDNDPKMIQEPGFDYCPYCHASVLGRI